MDLEIKMLFTQRGNFIIKGGRWEDFVTSCHRRATKCKEARERLSKKRIYAAK